MGKAGAEPHAPQSAKQRDGLPGCRERKWAREQGYSCCGFEVRLPNSGYRADVAAYRPASEVAPFVFAGKTSRRRQAAIGSTAVFECKQSRADLVKDSCLSA